MALLRVSRYIKMILFVNLKLMSMRVSKEIKMQPRQVVYNEILTAHQVMEILGIKRRKFDSLRKEGKLITYKVGRNVYCKYSELLKLVEDGRESIAA